MSTSTNSPSVASSERDSIPVKHVHAAADIAGAAILLNVAERIGLLPLMSEGRSFTASSVASELELPELHIREYLEALTHAGLVVSTGATELKAADHFSEMLHAVGYVSWTLNANRPFHEHAPEWFRAPVESRRKFPRNGHQIAVTSQWMGSEDFYPEARAAIFALEPRRFVDLGAGSARLLVEVLQKFPESTGVALDLSAGACAAARQNAANASVLDRLTIVERSIESVAEDPGVLEGADAIHGGFVFHDMLPSQEPTFDRVLSNCARALAKTQGRMLVTDAAPYVDNDRERMFSAAVSFIHFFFQGRRLLSEQEWSQKFEANGFASVGITRLHFPSGRLYTGVPARGGRAAGGAS